MCSSRSCRTLFTTVAVLVLGAATALCVEGMRIGVQVNAGLSQPSGGLYSHSDNSPPYSRWAFTSIEATTSGGFGASFALDLTGDLELRTGVLFDQQKYAFAAISTDGASSATTSIGYPTMTIATVPLEGVFLLTIPETTSRVYLGAGLGLSTALDDVNNTSQSISDNGEGTVVIYNDYNTIRLSTGPVLSLLFRVGVRSELSKRLGFDVGLLTSMDPGSTLSTQAVTTRHNGDPLSDPVMISSEGSSQSLTQVRLYVELTYDVW